MNRWARRAAALAAGLAGATLLGTPAGSFGPADPEPPVATIDYVALGDSYSAGPLVPDPRSDPAGCGRSTNNYPAYLAGYLQVRSYTDVTCSGAQTRDLRRSQSLLFGGRVRPQLDALSAETDLVTVGIGGNDFGLFGSIIGTCAAVRDRNPEGTPCRRAFTERIDGRRVDTLARNARRIDDRVARALEAVALRAPGAAVHLVGYPQLLPGTGTCEAVPFATGDYAWARHVEWLLNRSLRAAAERTGATFHSLYPASRGHDACGAEPWINGHVVRLGVAANFHPFQAGLRGAARSIYHQLTGLEAPSNTDAEPPPGSIRYQDVG